MKKLYLANRARHAQSSQRLKLFEDAVDEVSDPTRDELEAKAKELKGIV
jgi:hypothetical protein